MDSRDHRAVVALIDRYLTPSKRFTAGMDRDMRGHLRGCDVCRSAYDRRVSLHRLFSGGTVDMPSGLERSRMQAVLLDGVHATAPAPWRVWLSGLALAGAATAAILLVNRATVVPLPSPGDGSESRLTDDYIGSRGGAHADVTVGIGVSGVTEDGREYEVLASPGLYLDDYLRITTSREVGHHAFVAVVGLQEGRPPIWYSPNPEEGETRSMPVAQERSVPLGGKADPIEFKVAARHGAGHLVVAAIFTDTPIPVDVLAAALPSGAVTMGDSAGKVALPIEAALPGAVVRTAEFDVLPGSQRLEK
jgi:hypothetical protein